MKFIALLIFSLFLLTGCVSLTIKLTPTVEYPSTKMLIATETQAPTQTQAPTPTETQAPTSTEKPRFEQLIWPMIEDVMAKNEIHWETWQEELAIAKEQAEAVLSSDTSVYEDYHDRNYSILPGQMNLSRLTIEKPKVAYTLFMKHEDKEFLIIGIYTKARGANYSEPLPYALDLTINQSGMTNPLPGGYSYDYDLSVFDNDEKNYKKLVNGEAEYVTLWTTFMPGKATEDSFHKNLLWLWNEEKKIYEKYDYYVQSISSGSSDPIKAQKDGSDKAVEILSDYLIPTAAMGVDQGKD